MKKFVLSGLVIIAMLVVGVNAVLANQIYLPLVNKPGSTAQPPPGVQVLPNHTSYIDFFNHTHILGEVLNNTEIDREYVQIRVNFFDVNHGLIETDFTTAYLDTLTAWDKTCFHLDVAVNDAWSFYQFEVPTSQDYTLPVPALAIIDQNGSYDPLTGWYVIQGEIANDSNYYVSNVIVVGTLYNAAGTVVGCDFVYVDTIDLEAGQVSPFEMIIDDCAYAACDYADVTSYRIQAHGDPP